MIYYIITVSKVYIFNNFIIILNFSDFHLNAVITYVKGLLQQEYHFGMIIA